MKHYNVCNAQCPVMKYDKYIKWSFPAVHCIQIYINAS